MNKIPINEWETGHDQEGGYWIEPYTNKKWRWKGATVGEGQTWVGNPQIQAEKPLESKMKLMQEIAQKNTSLLVGPLTETQVEAIKAIISMSLIEYDAYLRAKILR